jgi:MFS family permease
LLYVNIVALIVNLVIQITEIWVLVICRVANGILVGLFMGIVPVYIHEISPHLISGFFGSFTQMQHLLGNVFSYLLGTLFYLCGIQNGFMMRFQF